MAKKRIAVIDYKKCKPLLCGRKCIKSCPINRQDKECIYEEDKIYIVEEFCTGCGICQHVCPFNAINIINLELDLENPIHQYGKNRFRLFRLPNVRDSKTIGLIGKNGIGKSTIVKILAGQIIPNRGDFENDLGYKPIVEFYKGKEMQEIFLKLKDNDFKVAYKPQNVELLSKNYDSKVYELLKKVDERNKLEEIIKLLEMENILDKNIKTLSGGELQKLAIAGAALKDANVYFYDEPSSFLDIRQRFIYANMMEKLNDTNMLVEHDLALLDYLSDDLHIIFGKPHVYGVVSNIKSPNNAINEFLDGFIKDENLRFRDYEIEFYYVHEKNTKRQDILFEYPKLKVEFDLFSLKIDEGKLYKGDVIGILGENGIGKSTFVKVIAGVQEANKKIENDLKIAYKPQSLMLGEDTSKTVFEYFAGVNQEVLKSELWNKLSLETIKDYKLSELNGGDLQKVIVAKTLAQDADIYLIDEPSAFLDVEERLNVAKAIRTIINKKGKVAFVVDHDILFIEYLSDRIIVFDGTPGKEGFANSPVLKNKGMNDFLKILNITYRKDPNTKRPRVNKMDSNKDKEQKTSGNYYIY